MGGRRDFLLASLVSLTPPALLASPAARAQTDLAIAMAERSLGRADAPVTILEFASFTCPHCARFHHEMLPRIRAEFIDTGKARLVFAVLPNDALALRAAMLAHCAPPERYFTLVSTLFQTQATWIPAADPMAALAQVAKLSGMTETQVQACLSDTNLQDALLERRMTAARQWKLTGTPTFLIGKSPLTEGAERIEGLNEGALVDTLRKLTAIPAR